MKSAAVAASLLFACAANGQSSTASAATSAVTGIKYLLIFGDSYTATGFNTNGAKPSMSNPIGNPNFPGSTFSGGINWVGDLVSVFNTSETLAYNFAVAGATVDNSIVAADGNIPSFVQQVSEFQSLGSKPWTSNNAIAGSFFGINDILNPFWKGQTAPVSQLLDRYFQELQALYSAGVRNFFVMEVPPLKLTPLVGGQSSSSQNTVMSTISSYNSGLASRLASFKSSNSGVNIAVVVDTSIAFDTATANPSKYGAPNASCENSNGVSCLWWDQLHPGQQIQKLFASTVASDLKGSFF